MGQHESQYPPLDKEGKDKYTFYWKNKRNEDMFARLYKPEVEKPKAVVFQFHGLHGHGASVPNMRLCQSLAKAGYLAITLDQTNHGRSSTYKTKGQIQNWHHLPEDGISFVEKVTTEPEILTEFGYDPDLPFFLMGASMGGCVAFHVSLELQKNLKNLNIKNRWLGTVFIAPLIYNLVSEQMGHTALAALSFFHTIGFGSLPLGPEPKMENFETLEIWENYKNDPFIYSEKMKLCTGANLMEMAETTQKYLEIPEFPFIVFHGDTDPIVSIRGSLELMEKSKTPAEKNS